MLEIDDYVGISFWIVTAIMLASTIFFLIERQDVPRKWKTSLTVASKHLIAGQKRKVKTIFRMWIPFEITELSKITLGPGK